MNDQPKTKTKMTLQKILEKKVPVYLVVLAVAITLAVAKERNIIVVNIYDKVK